MSLALATADVRPHVSRLWLAVGLSLLGFGVSVAAFWPGIMNHDSYFIYKYALEGGYGDWQSPVHSWIWRQIDYIKPPEASMLILTVGLYWLSAGLFAYAFARRSLALGIAAGVYGYTPIVFIFFGMMWRDMLLAHAWILAAALAYLSVGATIRVQVVLRLLAAVLVVFGALLRPSAIFAAPLVMLYVVAPARFRWKWAAAVVLPGAVATYLLIQFVYYDVLNAEKQNPLHSLFVFDIGAITHLTKQNQFPTDYPPERLEQLKNSCYGPDYWDRYWVWEKCMFTYQKLRDEKLFGSPALRDAWIKAITSHPIEYLRHRFAFLSNHIFGPNRTMWEMNFADHRKPLNPDNPLFQYVLKLHASLQASQLLREYPPPLYEMPGDKSLQGGHFLRLYPWILLGLVAGLAAWPRRHQPEGALAVSLTAASLVFTLSYLPFGVATEVRYSYFSILCAFIAAMAAIAAWQTRPEPRQPVASPVASGAARNA